MSVLPAWQKPGVLQVSVTAVRLGLVVIIHTTITCPGPTTGLSGSGGVPTPSGSAWFNAWLLLAAY